ncbi:MAG: DUF3500 domain-containing protein [Opitutaceae bacterium]|nr:DUF3500 domain-containing protein [Opitutaceae bacterium]
MRTAHVSTALIILAGFAPLAASAQQPKAKGQGAPASAAERSRQAEAAGLAEPFRGIATTAGIESGLFPIRASGVTTEPVRVAATAFLKALTDEQRKRTTYPVGDDEWRKWMNQHFYVRQGVSFLEMSEAQRTAAFALMRASLSAKGLQLSQDIMKLNHTLGELNNNDMVQYGQWLYHITIMGEPSADKPWGWQIDGHHLIINYFVLRDQVVMSPTFVGSEPVTAHAGKFKGVTILQEEQAAGLAMLRALDPAQRKRAVLEVSKSGNHNLTEAWKDNVVLDYAGLPAAALTPAQREKLLKLAGLFIGNMDDGHARVKMAEVRAHLDRTHFAWIGGDADDSVFYFRIHSPVVLIEFDHQRPANLRHLAKDPSAPNREHIHVVIRTPNGNDYGKDLLRQHHAQVRH